jgi:mannose-1-phosphate guanylyltransferase
LASLVAPVPASVAGLAPAIKAFRWLRAGGKGALYRASQLAVSDHIAPLIVTNKDYYFLSRIAWRTRTYRPAYWSLPGTNTTRSRIALAQPVQPEEDACGVALTDHLIKGTPTFTAAVQQQAEALARQNQLVLFGVRLLQSGNRLRLHC